MHATFEAVSQTPVMTLQYTINLPLLLIACLFHSSYAMIEVVPTAGTLYNEAYE